MLVNCRHNLNSDKYQHLKMLVASCRTQNAIPGMSTIHPDHLPVTSVRYKNIWMEKMLVILKNVIQATNNVSSKMY